MSKSILLAEDDRFLRRACETKLKQAGFDVRVAVDGEEALTFAREQVPDLADMVEMVVGEQHHRGRDGQAIGSGKQRLDRPTRVDHDGTAAGVIANQVGVREILSVARVFDDHRLMVARR